MVPSMFGTWKVLHEVHSPAWRKTHTAEIAISLTFCHLCLQH